MPATSLYVRVTEPTMNAGVWTLAAFYWCASASLAHRELADEWTYTARERLDGERNRTCSALDYWLDDKPPVAKWHARFEANEYRNYANDSILVEGRASGWFALSDDEDKTENLLKLVNCDVIEGMPQLYWDERGLVSPEGFVDYQRRASLLRPGSVNNDINPDFRVDWSAGPIRYRTTERYSAFWAPWRNIYGTSSESTAVTNRAMAALIDDAMRNPISDPPPQVIVSPAPDPGPASAGDATVGPTGETA